MPGKLTDLLRPTSSSASETQAGSPSVVSRREAFMLDLEYANGNRFSLPYTSLLFLKLDPSTALVATFSTHVVTLKGVHLLSVYEALVARSAGTIKAVHGRPIKHPVGVPVIFSIEVAARSEKGSSPDD